MASDKGSRGGMSIKVNIIAAVADNLALGNRGGLLWHISEDLKYFKRVTMGCPVIMGRKTFDSIGRALPGRLNVVISRNPEVVLPAGVVVAGSLEEALKAAEGKMVGEECGCEVVEGGAETGTSRDVFVIGGGEIYRQALPLADKLYITYVHTVPPEADTYFPEIDPEVWETVEASGVQHDETSGLDFEFGVYARKGRQSGAAG